LAKKNKDALKTPTMKDGSAPAMDITNSAGPSPYNHLLTALSYDWGQSRRNPFATLYRFFSYQWEQINESALEPKTNKTSHIPLLVLVIASFALTLMEYYGSSRDWNAFLKWLSTSETDWGPWAKEHVNAKYAYKELWGFGYWSMARFFGYVAVPCLGVWLFLRGEKVSSYGLSLKSAQSNAKLYITLYLMIAPVVFLASFTPGFQHTYPFYSQASRSWPDFLIFEFFYGFQFFSLEFFFRGFLLHSIKRYVGAYAIFIMLVPYCMIHFGKPLSETLGAIGAGIILGTLSLRTNSIWGGVGIHVAVAVSMDVCSMWQKGLL
jgi:uncharacterized protein